MATLRLDTALYGGAILVDRLLGLLLLPLLARAIDRADYGAWTQTAITAGVLMPLVLFAFPTAVVRSFAGQPAAAWRWRFFGRMGAVAVALFVLCALLLLGWQEPMARLVYGQAEASTLLPALLGLLAADAGSEFGIAWLRAVGRTGWVAAVLILRSVLRYGVVLALVAGGGSVLAEWLGRYVAVQCGATILVLTGTALLLRTQAAQISTHGPTPGSAPASVAPRMGELLQFSAPLVGLALFTALNAYVDRFLLVHVLGLDGVAVYAAAVSLCGVPAVFYNVLGFTLFPVLARHWGEHRRDEAARLTTRALQVFLFLCLPVALLIALTGPRLLPLLTTAEYRAAPAVFALLGLSVTAFGLYQIVLYTLLLDGRSREVLLLAMVAAAVNLGLNLVLAPRLGALGAALAAALSHALMVGVAGRLVRRALLWDFPWGRLWPLIWRAGVAALPLAALVAALPAASWPLLGAAVAGSALLYFALDLARPASTSVMRLMWPRRTTS